MERKVFSTQQNFAFNCTQKKLRIPYSLYAIIMHAISKKLGIFITHSTMWNPQHRQTKSAFQMYLLQGRRDTGHMVLSTFEKARLLK